MIVVPSTSGDQCAGSSFADLFGSQGKAQAPSPSQALTFFLCVCQSGKCALLCLSVFAGIVGVAAQEFLREIRMVMGLEALGIIG
ncbi:MAG: hypothetical protein CVT75_00195 [Alphaproteobacteria bacterium HGW-Alphaproteobacteria-14]|nr:MAG: hypothetical protein CVT75_00195 [Alphaproteobacteria bacterium HGW-Alphaproteobacteria-14]